MSILLSTSLLALCLAQSPAPTNTVGAGSGVTKTGSSTGGATVKKGGHDLADLLAPLAGTARRSGTLAPPSPPNGTNVQVSSPNVRSQWLPSIAVDPTNRLHLVGTALDRRNYTASNPDTHAAFYASFDGGATWSEFLDTHTAPPFTVPSSAVAFGPAGETYLFRSLTASPWPGLDIGVSADGGLTEPTWIPTSAGGNGHSVAVDMTHGPYRGTIYVASYSFYFAEGDFYFVEVSRSSDGGQTWDYVYVDDSHPQGRYYPPSIAVDSSGVVHVVFSNVRTGKIQCDSSSDGGVTWGSDITIASLFAAPRLAVDNSGGPYDGTLYVAWTQLGATSGRDAVFSRSTDHGTTWSSPVPASDVTTNKQFAPAVAVDPEGTVNFGFYDARDDANNKLVYYYLSRSSDGGATLLPNVKLSDTAFDPSTYTSGDFIEQGSGIAASDRMVHALWTDGRNGNNDIFGAAASLDLFTDVSVISAATGGTVNLTIDPGPLFQFAEYHVLGSVSGTTPGTDFYFENLPINYDGFTLGTIYDANSNVFPGFTGTLDASGAATAQVVSGPLPPALIGIEMDFATLVRVNNAVRWGSAPTSVVIGN